MSIFTRRRNAKTLRKKLFVNMMIMTTVLLFVIFAGLFFVGSIDVAQVELEQALELQMEVFRRELDKSFENLAVMGMQLSNDMALLIESGLADGDSVCNLDGAALTELQDAMLEPLKQRLQYTDCSGVFALLDATVDPSGGSKSGVYLQRNGFASPYTSSILLYRGSPQISKKHGVMLHRKWRLELDASLFPNYFELMSTQSELTSTASELASTSPAMADATSKQPFHISELITLPGTSEEAMLLTVPIEGEDGTVYGLCGFELSQSYFKWKYAQPTKLDRLLCVFAREEGGIIDMTNCLSCGTLNGYYLLPGNTLSYGKTRNGFVMLHGEQPQVGLLERAELLGQTEHMILAVMIPMTDYSDQVIGSVLQITSFIALLLFFGVICCLFFSKKFLAPIIMSLKELKEGSTAPKRTNVFEIDDLFDFLAQKDSEYEERVRLLANEKQDIQTEYAKAQTNLARLADRKAGEIDDDSLQTFLSNLGTLTNREREVFDLYLDGKKAKDIHELLGMSENTVKFHNKNIYGKLGISSRKQLLQYAALMEEQDKQELSE